MAWMDARETDAAGLDSLAHERYAREGYYLAPRLVPPDLLEQVVPRMYAVIAGDYETGIAPHARNVDANPPPGKLCKIDDAHVSDRTIHKVISYPELGRWAAAVTGASWVQVWATQLLVKPPASEGAASAGNVGWHQDKQYWAHWDGEVFTAWIAISNVTIDSGAMRFVRGSHRWGFRNEGDFFAQDTDGQLADITVPEGEAWEEAPAVLAPGAVSFHHRHTFHGSGPNLSAAPRLSFAVHMRTEKSRPIGDNYYVTRLDDPLYRPVIFGG